MFELPIFEWVLKGLADPRLHRLAMRILGNITNNDAYCEYFKTHCFCEMMFPLEPIDFAANDDFYIFVCRMAMYDPAALSLIRELPAVLDGLVDNLRSEHSECFWISFSAAIGKLLGVQTEIGKWLLEGYLEAVLVEITDDENIEMHIREWAELVLKEFFQPHSMEEDQHVSLICKFCIIHLSFL
jgi:hypothetical protein